MINLSQYKNLILRMIEKYHLLEPDTYDINDEKINLSKLYRLNISNPDLNSQLQDDDENEDDLESDDGKI